MADNYKNLDGSITIGTDEVKGVHYGKMVQGHTQSGDWVAASPSNEGTQKLLLSRFLDTNGDGSGTKNANGDYSGAAEIFYIQPPASTVYRISRMMVSIQDTSGMTPEEYGNLGTALANGVEVRVEDDSGTVADLTDQIPVQTNANWGQHCYDVDLKTWGTTPSDEEIVVRWTFLKSGQFIRLDGDSNERLEVVVNDDLDGLIGHYFKINGYVE